MQVHGINAHVGIALEDLLIAPVWHGRVQAADLAVVSDVEHLSRSISLAGVIDSGKVFVADTLVGTLSVVADVGTHTKLLALVLISTAVTSIGLEAWFAGAERVGAVHHAMSFISISTHCPVTAAVIQHRVFLIAVDFIRTVVLAVIEVVAAQDRADAETTGALELIFLTHWSGRSRWAVDFIAVVPTVVDSITAF